jgi:hypothetical protein
MKHKIVIVVASLGLLAGGFVYFECTSCANAEETFDLSNLDGTWHCETAWSWDKEGTAVPCSAKSKASCTKNVLSSTGVISIGDAQWNETIEGQCYASDRDLYGTRTSTVTVPKNEAARQFERDRLEGKSFASIANEHHRDYRIRITSVTETQFQGTNQEGRIITCNRP